MSSNKTNHPTLIKKGYQPKVTPPSDPKPQGGYQPTGTGVHPTKVPSPPKKD